MTRWKCCTILVLALAFGALGCGGGSSTSGIVVTVMPSTASVILNQGQPFTATVNGTSNGTVTWSLTCASGVTSCGTIDSSGHYKAPSSVPSTPSVTIKAVSQANTSVSGTATVTIISGITITITPTSATIGTKETFPFTAEVTNPGCDFNVDTTCRDVTWSVSSNCVVVAGAPDCTVTTTTATTTAFNMGLFHAPATAPSPNAVTLTATAVKDTTITAIVTVTVVTAVDPTLTSVSPSTVALGSLFQDVYITGTNFISTNIVTVTGTTATQPTVTAVSNTVLRVRIPDFMLATPPPSGLLVISAKREGGAPQMCTPDPTKCQIVVAAVRPVVVGPSPDSVPQGTAGVLNFIVNGGFFGTATNPTVNATYDGGTRAAKVVSTSTALSTRQLSVSIGGASNASDFGTPGLHQVEIHSNADNTKFAATNLAVQPNYSISAISSLATDVVGTTPSDVAVNPATGMAVVVNSGSNDATLIDLNGVSPEMALCTGTLGATAVPGATAPSCAASGPSSVAVDYVRNIALVANNASKNVVAIDLKAKMVTWVSPTLSALSSNPQDSPVAVGINSVTGRALVAVSTRNYGLLIDLNGATPAIKGVVSIANGPNPQIAVEPHLNWAVSTPGSSVGSLGIVDLSRQTINNITNLSRTSGVVTVTVQPSTANVPQPVLAVQPNDSVLIQGVSDNSFNGIFSVTGIGPGTNQFTYTENNDSSHPDKTTFVAPGTVNYAQPVATFAVNTSVVGVGINPETQKAILLDPTGSVSFLSLLDQSITPLPTQSNMNFSITGNVAGAFNPLTNVAVVVNSSPTISTNQLSVIDPTTPTVLTTFTTGKTPVAVAVDPGSNKTIVANQGDNTVSILSLGSSIRALSITETFPKTFVVNSSLSSPPTPSAQPLTVIGKGFTDNSVVRLDGVALPTTRIASDGDRELTATVPPSLLANARRFAVDVEDAGVVSNVSDFTVVQSVDVGPASGSGCTSLPMPSGVAVDAQQNLAVVSLSGCNTVALIDLSSGTGKTVAVGQSPSGVAVLPLLHEAVVANTGSSSASVVDELGQTVTKTITTGSSPVGVAADQDTSEVAVANSVSNTVTIIGVATGSTTTITTGARPIAVAFNNTNHQIAVAETGSNQVAIADAGGTTVNPFPFTVNDPTSLVFDPVPDPTTGLASNFLAASSTGNSLEILNTTTQIPTGFSVGINPTAIAYNYLTSTLIFTNTASETLTVVDFLGPNIGEQVRAVVNLPPPPVTSALAVTGGLQFGVDIHPFTNVAVVADTANGRVLLVPVPR